MFAHVLLARLDPLLQKHRRPQQSGFTRCRSTLEAILALRLLTEIHREFQQHLHVTYVDLKAAFDSVDRTAVWKAMRGIGVPTILLDRIIDLHCKLIQPMAAIRNKNHISLWHYSQSASCKASVISFHDHLRCKAGLRSGSCFVLQSDRLYNGTCLAQDRNTSWHRHPH